MGERAFVDVCHKSLCKALFQQSSIPCLVPLQNQSFPKEYSLISLTCFLHGVFLLASATTWVPGTAGFPRGARTAESSRGPMPPPCPSDLCISSHILPGTSLVLSHSPSHLLESFASEPCYFLSWLSSLTEKDESHLRPAGLMLHRPLHCQNPQNSGSDTSHEAMY